MVELETNLSFNESSSSSSSPLIQQSTCIPTPRWGHTITTISPNQLLLYGGQTLHDDDFETLFAVYIFNLLSHTWSKPINSAGFAHTWHTSTFIQAQKLLICFGGESIKSTGRIDIIDKLMVLDTEIMLWYKPAVSGPSPGR